MKHTLYNDFLTISFTDLGGALTSIKNKDGLEFLWQGDPTYWSGQAPVLFPICGSLRADKAINLEGDVISMPRHGIVRKRGFVCEQQTGKEIIFSITSDEEMEKQFPYQFKLNSRYELQDNSLLVEYTVFNRSSKSMPFFIGGHPGFNCPIEDGLKFSDYYVRFDQPVNSSVADSLVESGLVDRKNRIQLDFDGQKLPMQHDLFRKDALVFDHVSSKKAELKSDKSEHSVMIEYEDFPNLLIWSTAHDAPFVALEPMLGLSTDVSEDDIFEHKHDVQVLDAGQFAKFTYRLIFN